MKKSILYNFTIIHFIGSVAAIIMLSLNPKYQHVNLLVEEFKSGQPSIMMIFSFLLLVNIVFGAILILINIQFAKDKHREFMGGYCQEFGDFSHTEALISIVYGLIIIPITILILLKAIIAYILFALVFLLLIGILFSSKSSSSGRA